MAPNIVRSFLSSYHYSTTLSYIERLNTSWLLSPAALFALRALQSTYIFIVIFTVLGIDAPTQARHSFSFFTDLCYWGLGFYFAFAAAHTASYAFRGKSWLESWPKVLRWMHSALYATVTVYPWVVTAVFWAVLSQSAYASRFSSFTNISEHALNSVFAFLEIVLPASDPHPWIQLIPIIVILALYLGLAYLTHTSEGFYVYDFLDPANGRGLVAGACIGILVAAIVAFILVRYLIWFRRWVVENKLGLGPKRSSRAPLARPHEAENGEPMADVTKG